VHQLKKKNQKMFQYPFLVNNGVKGRKIKKERKIPSQLCKPEEEMINIFVLLNFKKKTN
jgi:hypothetical protein